ncbi:MAG TPA: FapA family protein [Clostridiales bacterium]|nr:FapA family protein [Clostridiales bacterium]
MGKIIVEGDSFDKALEKGLSTLGTDVNNVNVEILDEGQKVKNVVLKPCKLLITLKNGAKGGTSNDLFILDYRADGVYMTVMPPSTGLTKDQERSIIQYINRKQIEGLDKQALFQSIYSHCGQWVQIAPPQREKNIDEEIQVSISNDQMKAFITLFPPLGGKVLSKTDIIEELHSNGVVFGIDENKIDEILRNRKYETQIIVAQGKEPQDGKDGQIIYHVSLDKDRKPLIKEDGTVDYFHLDMVENVKKGQRLVTIIPPTKGEPGKTVTGKKIYPKPGKPKRIGVGKNVTVSDDGLELLSNIDGRVELIGNKIHVYNTLEINGDVDTSTGNIDFIGNVIVQGNVLTGFEINARGHIKVLGVVEGAILNASGDVVIQKGIQGMGKGVIKAGGKVVSRFIENAIIDANEDVISEAIMHSYVQSGGKVHVGGRKGLIVGGSIKATLGIIAGTIGAPMGTSTILEVGLNPSLRNEYNDLKNELEKIENELKKVNQAIQLLERLEEKGELSAEKKLIKLKVLKTRDNCLHRLPVIKARIEELKEIFNDVVNGKISVHNIIYPGVKIIIGTSNMQIYEEMKYVTFTREQGNISISSYSE